jgi:hypothetical protein
MDISRRLSRREKKEREKLGDITLQIREITAKPGVYRMLHSRRKTDGYRKR